MAKTATINVRIDPEIKDKTEKIFDAIGISTSSAIEMFYRQVISRRGLPFEARIPDRINGDKMTKEELAHSIEESYADYKANGGIPLEKLMDEFEKKANICVSK